jgi:cytochrome c2
MPLLALLQILCAGAIALLLPAQLHSPLRETPQATLLLAGLFGLSYLACAGWALWRERTERPLDVLSLFALVLLSYIPPLMYLALTRGVLLRRILLVELVLGAGLLGVTALMRRVPAMRTAALALVVVAAGVAILKMPAEGAHVLHAMRVWKLNSQLYGLKIHEYRTLIGHSKSTGGAITSFRDRYVVTTGDGDLYFVIPEGDGRVPKTTHLPYRIPMNEDAFLSAVGDGVETVGFRAADLLLQEDGDKVRMYASHHFWEGSRQCSVMRISMLEQDTSAFLQGVKPAADWKTIYESSPCIPINFPGTAPSFGGVQVGGRMTLISPHELLVTVGDSGLDGVGMPISAPQDANSSYGKTVSIDLTDFSSHVFSIGHRDPQGLFADRSGSIWLTEHGPQGGDELNLIQRGMNYGWPMVSYGVQYGTHTWPTSPVPGSHAGYMEPFYSWVPSIGISSVLVVHGPLFKYWNDDLIVASLRDRSLYRQRVRQGRIVMTERIPLGRRIRDVTEGPNGELAVYCDNGGLMVITVDDDVGTGEVLFTACAGCHAINDGVTHGIGPDLRHVVGHRSATAHGYRYSNAMLKLNKTWTPELLDEFLADPQKLVPGTKMRFAGIASAQDRARLVEFLESGAQNYPPPEEDAPEMAVEH